MISPPLLVVLSIGALCASGALLMARLQYALAADILAFGAALAGLAAVATAAVSTVQHARRLSRGRPRS